jgi:hypothetical protein
VNTSISFLAETQKAQTNKEPKQLEGFTIASPLNMDIKAIFF